MQYTAFIFGRRANMLIFCVCIWFDRLKSLIIGLISDG